MKTTYTKLLLIAAGATIGCFRPHKPIDPTSQLPQPLAQAEEVKPWEEPVPPPIEHPGDTARTARTQLGGSTLSDTNSIGASIK
jgi:hypothetical protein